MTENEKNIIKMKTPGAIKFFSLEELQVDLVNKYINFGFLL